MNSSCPVCGNQEYKAEGKPKVNDKAQSLLRTERQVVKCIGCGLYFVSPAINFSQEEWTVLYGSEYFPEPKGWLKTSRDKELKQRFDKAEKYNPGIKRFLDIGTGEGNALLEAAKRGWEIWSQDIYDNRLTESKNLPQNFHEGNLFSACYEKDHFDLIYMDSILEHVVNPLDLLNETKRILKPGGIIYAGIPNEDSLFNEIKKLIFLLTGKREESVKTKPFDTPYHVTGFNKNSIKTIVRNSGLSFLKLENFGRKFNFLAFRPSQRAFWINLLILFPVEYLGYFLGKDVYFGAWLTKK